MSRYALYYAPASDTPLARFGAAWLGRDAVTGAALDQPAVPGLDLAAVTVDARRYGFHATIKAPFALAPGRTPDDLVAALADFAARATPVEAPPLRPAVLGAGFIALVPRGPYPALSAFAAAVVRGFDDFRALPGAAERARRLAAGLTPRQQELLDRWGYPYVLEQFAFHMTLTDALDPARQEMVRAALAPRVARFATEPLHIDALALFHEPEPGAPFRLTARWRLGGSRSGE